MPTRPFNEECLWKSKMERTGILKKRSLEQPPMTLPIINSHTGGTKPDDNDIHGDRVKRNAYNSAVYWAGVNERKAAYRIKYKFPLDEQAYFAEQFESTLGLEKGGYIFRRQWTY